jgi:hypothetical protein
MIVNVKKRLWGVLLLAAVSVSVQAENTYTLAGPYEVIARDGTYRSTKAGSERDMKAAPPLPHTRSPPLKHDYEVYVQPRGSKEWTRIDTYMAKVNAPIGDNVSGIEFAE